MNAVVAVLGLAAFVISSPLGASLLNLSALVPDGDLFSLYMDALCVFVSIACVILALARKRLMSGGVLERMVVIRPIAVCYIAGSAAPFLTPVPSGVSGEVLFVLFALLSSVGLTGLTAVWAYRLRYSLDGLIVCAAAVLGGSAICFFAFKGLSASIALVMYMVLLVLGAGYLCSGTPLFDREQEEKTILDAMGFTERQLRILLVPVALGLMLLGFVLGVGGHQLVFGEDPWPLGFFVAAIIVGSLVVARRVRLLDLLTCVCIPVAVLGLFVLCMFISVNPVIQQITTLISYTIFGLVCIVGSSLFVRLSHGRTFSVVPSALACALFFLSFLGGTLAARNIDSELFGVVLLAVSVLHAALMAAAPIYLKRLDGARLEEGSAPLVDGRRDSLAELSAEAGLSEREAEILSYIARGYGASHIAGELTLAASTVRTHCNNIYRKLGVTSREEALSLIESKAPDERV